MRTDKAMFLINQLNPVFKKSKCYIRHLEIDTDNEDIKMNNMFKATLYRVHYGSKDVIEVTHEIMENARG